MAESHLLPRFEEGEPVDGSHLNRLVEAIESRLAEEPGELGSGFQLQRELILGEIGGKNAAIHAYDKIIWIIRSGFVSIVFGAWALLLTGAARGGGLVENRGLVGLLTVLTFGAALFAWYADRNYVQRKFKVIASLDLLMDFVLTRARMLDPPGDSLVRGEDATLAMWLLSVSGDQPFLRDDATGSQPSAYREDASLAEQVRDSLEKTTFSEALRVGLAIYLGAFFVFVVLWLLSLIVL